MTLRIAITGGIGAGKSQLAGWLRAAGHPVLDADEIGREVLEAGPELRRELAATFGEALLLADGSLDRAELGRRAFASAEALAKLNALVFPYLGATLRRRLEGVTDSACFVDAALIFEWGVQDWFDEIWLVQAPEELRLARACRRLGLSLDEARRRLARQLPSEEKARRAAVVLDNGGPPRRMWEQAGRELARLGLAPLPLSSRPSEE